MLLEGKKWEEKYEQTKELPDPKTTSSEDEFYLYELFREIIPQDTKRFRNLLKDFYGVSEETTTGVHRLMYLEKQNQLLFPAFNVRLYVNLTNPRASSWHTPFKCGPI